MKYSVRIMVPDNKGRYGKGKRYNYIPKKILKFLIRHEFCFTIGINYSRNTVYDRYASNYVEVYLKSERNHCGYYNVNKYLNDRLERILAKYGRKTY